MRLAHRGICERTSAQSYAHLSNLSHEANITCLSNTAQHKYQCDLHMCLRHTHPNPAIIMPVAQVSPLTSHLPHLKQLILVGQLKHTFGSQYNITLHPSRLETANTSAIDSQNCRNADQSCTWRKLAGLCYLFESVVQMLFVQLPKIVSNAEVSE